MSINSLAVLKQSSRERKVIGQHAKGNNWLLHVNVKKKTLLVVGAARLLNIVQHAWLA
jgi:hypothetical protein